MKILKLLAWPKMNKPKPFFLNNDNVANDYFIKVIRYLFFLLILG